MKSTKTNDILNYGQMVHEKRRAINMTEEKLAELTDRSDKEIRNIECGASIIGSSRSILPVPPFASPIFASFWTLPPRRACVASQPIGHKPRSTKIPKLLPACALPSTVC